MIEASKKRASRVETPAEREISEDSAISLKKHKSSHGVCTSDKENVGESHTFPRGLYNESNTCYLNSLIQVLFHLLPFRELIFSFTSWQQSHKVSVLEALQWLFIDLAEGAEDGETVTTHRLTKAFGWTSVNRGLQQDIHEFMQTLFNCLEKELSSEDFMKLSSLLTGKLERCIKCEAVGYESRKCEDVRGLPLATVSFINIERSLEDMFKNEQVQMTIDNHGKQVADIKVDLTEVPKVLLLTLNRLKYDPAEEAVVKVTDYFEYREKLELCGHVYRLHSAVVHEGTAVSGHYYCYISPTCNNKWYMFNDDKVTHSDITSAVKDNYGRKTEPRGPTSYLVTYIRQDCTEFFKPTTARIPDRLRERISSIRNLEKVRLERIQTAHLYTTISLASWAMLKGHHGYDLCDRVRLDQLHKDGETNPTDGLTNMRVLKTCTVQELITQYDNNLSQSNLRLWTFTERSTNDGWSTHRPDKLIKDWNSTIATVSKLRCPFYIYVETLASALHPVTLADDMLSVFVKVFHDTRGAQDMPTLDHHIILSIETTIDSLKSTVFEASGIDQENADANIYQEHSSMCTERVECDGETQLSDALGGQLLRHATILIVEIVSKQSATDTGAVVSDISSQQTLSITNTACISDLSTKDQLSTGDDTMLKQSETAAADTESTELKGSESNVVSRRQDCVLEYMRKLGNKVMVTWYNRSKSYLPSHTDGDFTLELYIDMQMCEVIERLASHLNCGLRNLKVYEVKRDQGYPQLQDKPVYDSISSVSLLKLLYKQVQHSVLWRHSATLYYQQLAMTIEELSVRHTVTCSYISVDRTSHTLTLYPRKCRAGSTQPSTVADLLLLASSEICLLNTTKSSRPMRLLIIANKRIAQIPDSEQLISGLLQEELRLEHISEEEEEAESEFSEILGSVTIDSAYLLKRDVPTAPFLMVIDRSNTGLDITERIKSRLKIQDQWMDKIEYRLVIPGERSYVLHDGKLSVRDWGNLACDGDTGAFDGCNYIKVVDAPRTS